MKMMKIMFHIIKFDLLIFSIRGKIKVISTSKIKKIIVIKKNRNEKGKRGDLIGSNPHSNGDSFSWSSFFFFEINDAIKFIKFDKIKEIKEVKINK